MSGLVRRKGRRETSPAQETRDSRNDGEAGQLKLEVPPIPLPFPGRSARLEGPDRPGPDLLQVAGAR